jgi:hypothetical protein
MLILMKTIKRGRGRPELPTDERKAAELRIRLTAAERAELDRFAGSNTSTWARDELLRIARRRRAPAVE